MRSLNNSRQKAELSVRNKKSKDVSAKERQGGRVILRS